MENVTIGAEVATATVEMAVPNTVIMTPVPMVDYARVLEGAGITVLSISDSSVSAIPGPIATHC